MLLRVKTMTVLALSQGSSQPRDSELKRLLRMQEELFRRTETDVSDGEIEKDKDKSANDKAEKERKKP